MNKEDLIAIIQQDIEDVMRITKAFNKDKIHQIEINLCLSKVQNLHDELQLLKEKLNTGNSIESEALTKDLSPELPRQIVEEKEKPEPKPAITEPVQNLTNEQAEESTEKVQPVKEDVEVEGAVEVVSIEEERKQEKPKAKAAEKRTSKKILGDELRNNKQSLHDQIANNKFEKDLATQFKSKPITDIKKAIPLNDRIWFTKELFNGNTDNFNSTIDKINQLNDLDDALTYIQDNHQWDSESQVVEKFLRVISRKFQ
jgi:hypothetical protein